MSLAVLKCQPPAYRVHSLTAFVRLSATIRRQSLEASNNVERPITCWNQVSPFFRKQEESSSFSTSRLATNQNRWSSTSPKRCFFSKCPFESRFCSFKRAKSLFQVRRKRNICIFAISVRASYHREDCPSWQRGTNSPCWGRGRFRGCRKLLRPLSGSIQQTIPWKLGRHWKAALKKRNQMGLLSLKISFRLLHLQIFQIRQISRNLFEAASLGRHCQLCLCPINLRLFHHHRHNLQVFQMNTRRNLHHQRSCQKFKLDRGFLSHQYLTVFPIRNKSRDLYPSAHPMEES